MLYKCILIFQELHQLFGQFIRLQRGVIMVMGMFDLYSTVDMFINSSLFCVQGMEKRALNFVCCVMQYCKGRCRIGIGFQCVTLMNAFPRAFHWLFFTLNFRDVIIHHPYLHFMQFIFGSPSNMVLLELSKINPYFWSQKIKDRKS